MVDLPTGYGITGIFPVFHWASVKPFFSSGAVNRQDFSRFVRPTAETIQRAAVVLAAFGRGTCGPRLGVFGTGVLLGLGWY